MPRKGYKSAMFNTFDNTTGKYKALTNSTVPKISRVIDEKLSVEYNNAELYADDVLAESDYSFKKGTLTITKADDNDLLDAELLGNTVQTNAVTFKVTDAAPEIGYGHIVTKQVEGVISYKVEFLPRVKFNKITTDGKTKGEGVEFGTTTMEGTVKALEETFNGIEAGTWKVVESFTTYAAAVAKLTALLSPYVAPGGGGGN